MNEPGLARLADITRRHADQAAQRLVEAQAAVRQAEAQLQQLQGFAAEYATGGAATAPWQLSNRQAFRDRLQAAIHCQQQRIDQAQAAVTAARASWMTAWQAAESLGGAAALQRDDLLQARLKRQQRQEDDLVNTRTWSPAWT
jgi:flagellar protein FliJ